MADQSLFITQLPDLKLSKRGKVRDIYEFNDSLLIVSTDRISCFDVVLPTGIPYKGEILTRLSVFWFNFIKDIVHHHLITDKVDDFPQEAIKYEGILKKRSMLVKKATPIPFEFVVRGYLAGSGWKEYQEKQSICGQTLPPGLREADKLPSPIFTPSTKAEIGHDLNISQEYMEKQLGQEMTARLKEISLTIYNQASQYAEAKGIIIADTKFEFGTIGQDLILIDELLTPDSSRFWPKSTYQPGTSQPSFDKQYVRDYLETLLWDKTPPGPPLPEEIIIKTTEKYLQAYKMITADLP